MHGITEYVTVTFIYIPLALARFFFVTFRVFAYRISQLFKRNHESHVRHFPIPYLSCIVCYIVCFLSFWQILGQFLLQQICSK